MADRLRKCFGAQHLLLKSNHEKSFVALLCIVQGFGFQIENLTLFMSRTVALVLNLLNCCGQYCFYLSDLSNTLFSSPDIFALSLPHDPTQSITAEKVRKLFFCH